MSTCLLIYIIFIHGFIKQTIFFTQKFNHPSYRLFRLLPSCCLIDYWKVRTPHKGLVFQATNGPSVKRHYLSTNKILLVAMTGHDASGYDTHGLRIGRTTDIARAGVPDHIIKETGPWESHAYKLCMRSFVCTLPP